MYQALRTGKTVLAGIGLAAAIMLAAPAQAALTPIGSNPSEPTLLDILNSLYGAGNYTRIDDANDNAWPLPGSPRGDVVANFLVRYAADRGQFGFYRDGTGAFTPLFSFGAGMPATNVTPVGAYAANPDGSFTIPLADLVSDTTSGTFEWAYWNRTKNLYYSSNAADNTSDPGHRDHMVTFEIDDSDPTSSTFVIGWEDRLAGDYDFQDAVIQLTFRNAAVPEPMTLTLLGAGLLGLAFARRRRPD